MRAVRVRFSMNNVDMGGYLIMIIDVPVLQICVQQF